MIDLTPIDVRKKKADFRRGIRGYETPQVDDFLDLVAERLEAVVRENAEMSERLKRLDQQLAEFKHREKALTDALVTAQTLREEIRSQSTREGDETRRKAVEDAARVRDEAEAAVSRMRQEAEDAVNRLRREASEQRAREEELLSALRNRQLEFVSGYRAFLARELAHLESQVSGIEERLGTKIPELPAANTPWLAEPPSKEANAAVESASTSDAGITDSAIVADDTSEIEAIELNDFGWDDDATRAQPSAPAQQASEWAPSEETFQSAVSRFESAAPAQPSAAETVVDELDDQIGSLLAEWSPEVDEPADEIVDFLLSDEDVDGDTADDTDLVLSDDDVIGGHADTDHARLYEDDEEAAFIAATGFGVQQDAMEESDAFELSESDVIADERASVEVPDDIEIDIDALLAESDPFADDEPAFTIGPAPARPTPPAADVMNQAVDDAAFLDDLNEEIHGGSPNGVAPAHEAPEFDPFEDDGGFVIGPARNGHATNGAAHAAEQQHAQTEEQAPLAAHDDVEESADDSESDDGMSDDSAAFGEDPRTLDHLLDAAGLPKSLSQPESKPMGSFSASFGLTLRPTFNGGDAEEEDADRTPRSRGEVRDFYSVPRALE